MHHNPTRYEQWDIIWLYEIYQKINVIYIIVLWFIFASIAESRTMLMKNHSNLFHFVSSLYTNICKPSNTHTSSFIDIARQKWNSCSNKINPPLILVIHVARNRRNINQYLSAIKYEIWEKFVHRSILVVVR